MGMFGATYSNELFVDEDNACEIGEMILDITLNGFVFDITSDGSDQVDLIED